MLKIENVKWVLERKREEVIMKLGCWEKGNEREEGQFVAPVA